MAKVIAKTKENPKLMQVELADGRTSLYLEYYLGRKQWIDEQTGKTKVKHDRRKESLNLYLSSNPRTPNERTLNKETLELAHKIRAEREQEMKSDIRGYRVNTNKGLNFLDYFQSYINNYTKKDKKMLLGSYNRLKDFLSEKYPLYATTIKPSQLTKEMMVQFVEYLETKSIGEGAHSYFSRFKKVVRFAHEQGVIPKNPCTGVSCKVDTSTLRKDVLSDGEITTLLGTKYPEQNLEVRKAFIFSLYTGARFCDVIDMKFKNIDYSNKRLVFEQIKTKGKSASSGVVVPLSDDLIRLIGETPLNEDGERMPDLLLFNLPSQTMCNKSLQRWVNKAGIPKHITWHCARHSFATTILSNGANIKTVSSLLGHSGLKHTEKYTRAVDSLKEAAIDSLPKIQL